jgi:DNA-binding response OmpR family regulator
MPFALFRERWFGCKSVSVRISIAMARPLALIIEDDPMSAEALALILKDWGAEVMQGSDAACVDAAHDRKDDLRFIITDFHLGPGPDGITLTRRLRQAAHQARVLVLSGSFHGRAMAAADDAGYEVMQKPARAEAILEWLERG